MDLELTIEVPDEELAEALQRRLDSFDVDASEVDAHWELRIHLVERNPERRIKGVLHAIDSWLPEAHIDSVRVHLDGRSYLLQSSPAGIGAARA